MPSTPYERLGKIGIYAVALLPFAYFLFIQHVPLKYFVFGSGSWGVGCLFKMLFYHLGIRKLDPARLSSTVIGLINGTSSGVCELGAALLAFLYLGPMTLLQVISFGVGIGSFEAWIVGSIPNLLQGTAVEGRVGQMEAFIKGLPAGQRFIHEAVYPVLERIVATAGHVGSRALLFVTFVTANPIPAIGGLAFFVIADGLIAYRFLLRTDDFRTSDLLKIYAWFSITALVCLAAGIWLAGQSAVLN